MRSMDTRDNELPPVLLGPDSSRIVSEYIKARDKANAERTTKMTNREPIAGAILRTNGKIDRVQIENFKDMQRAVGGYIELLPTENSNHGFDAYIHEEGRITESPINMTACLWLLRSNIYPALDQPIHGDVLIVGPVDPDTGYNTSISDDIVETVPRFWVEPSFTIMEG